MEWALLSWPTLILLGLGVRMAVRLHYGARGPDPGDPIYVFLNTASWVLIILGLLPAIVGGTLTFVGLIIVLLAVVTLVEAVVERRAAQRRSMCTLLTLLIERGEHLDSSVLLAGQSSRGIVGRAARRLFAALEGGTPLAAAIHQNPGALPREASAYLAAGKSMDAEIAALKELCRTNHSGLATIWRACVDRISYLASVLLVLSGVLTFLMIKIVPEYEKIFEEFEIDLPPVTQLAVSSSAFVVNYLSLPLALLLPLLTLSALGTAICYLCDVPLLRWLGDRLFRGQRLADVLRILAIATEHRQSLPTALTRLAHVFPSAPLRRQLATAATSVAGGRDWRDALFEERFISQAERGLLHTAEQVGNLPWALRSIAERNEQRGVYRLAAAMQVLYPCVILLLGALVGFYVVSLFVPIVQLIEGLT